MIRVSSQALLRFFRRAPALAALLASGVAACTTEEPACSDDECGQAGAKSSGGSKESSGGARATGGRGQTGGAAATGGLGGSIEASGGNAGEPSGGQSSAEAGPRVVTAEIEGRTVELGESLRGVHEGASIKVTFSRPMDPLSVEDAYVARSGSSVLSSFIVAWNEENTELTLILRSRLKYEEVTALEGAPKELGFLLNRTARDEEGNALTEEFFITFSLLRRFTQFIEPDLDNSGTAYGNVPSNYEQVVDDQVVPTEYLVPIGAPGGNCPWLSSENEHDENQDTFRAEFPYTAARNFATAPGRHGSNPRGTRAGIYSFPLESVPEGDLERATLKLAKWTRVRQDTKDSDEDGSTTDYIPYYDNPVAFYELPFSVDALPPFALSESSTDEAARAVFGTSSWRANLNNSSGDEYSKSVGFFSFNVTDLVREGVDAGDPWAMYRAEFDGLPVVMDDPMTVCVTLGLEVAALVE